MQFDLSRHLGKLTGIGDLGHFVALKAVPALIAPCIDELVPSQ
jgi:hypothetical protein